MPLDMVVHKVSDIVARAKAGDKNAQAEYERFQVSVCVYVCVLSMQYTDNETSIDILFKSSKRTHCGSIG